MTVHASVPHLLPLLSTTSPPTHLLRIYLFRSVHCGSSLSLSLWFFFSTLYISRCVCVCSSIFVGLYPSLYVCLSLFICPYCHIPTHSSLPLPPSSHLKPSLPSLLLFHFPLPHFSPSFPCHGTWTVNP